MNSFLKLGRLGVLFLLLAMYSCGNELHITMPPGPEGKSSYEVWKEAVEDGRIDWEKDQTDVVDYFRFLKGEDGKDGKDGKSAYEIWVEMVKDGTIPDKNGTPWPTDKITIQNFWEYLSGADGKNGSTPYIGDNENWWIDGVDTGVPARGQDGQSGQDGKDGSVVTIGDNGNWHIDGGDTGVPANGTSAYELWIVEVLCETGLLHPHKDDGSCWPTDEISLSDFWRYLRGRDGLDGDCNCFTPKMNYIQPMSKATAATTLAQDVPANWIKKSSTSDYEGFVFLPQQAVTDKNPDLVTQITIPFWRQRFEFSISCEQSDIEVVLAGQNDLSGSWIDESKTDVDYSVTENGGIYSHVFRISFEANDLPTEEFRELTLRFRKVSNPGTYKDITIRQIYRPIAISRYSTAHVGELNTFATELTETNISSLNTDQRGYYYQWGRNIPIKPGRTYTNTGIGITWGTNHADLWDEDKFINVTEMYTGDLSVGDTWASKAQKAQTYSAPSSYVGSNGGDPCPSGWHLPTKPEHYSIFIGTKGTLGSDDQYRFSNSSSSNSINEGRVGGFVSGRDLSGVRWDYWEKDYSRASYNSTGTNVTGSVDNIFDAFKPIYAVKFISNGSYDVYENALKAAFKYEMHENSGFYYVKVTYRHLGEYSTLVSANDIMDDSFWGDPDATYYTTLIPLYGVGAANGNVGSLHLRTYYWTGDIRLISSPAAPPTLMIGGPGSTYSNPVDRYRTISAEWSFGANNAFMLRCIQDAPDPEISETWVLPDWNH